MTNYKEFKCHFLLKIKQGTTLIDITAEAYNVGEITYLSKNSDFTVIASGYSFNLSDAYTGSVIELDDTVLFYSDSKVMHSGYITKREYDYDIKSHKYQVENDLLKLKKYLANSDNLKDIMHSHSSTKNIFGYDREIIHSTNLLTSLFEAAGLTLDYSSYYIQEAYGTAVGYDYHYDGLYSYDLSSSVEDQLYFVPNQIYSMGQSGGAFASQSILSDDTRIGEQVTLFDVVSMITAMKGYAFVAINSSSFAVVNDRTNYTISGSAVISKQYEYIEPENGLKIEFNTLKLWPSNFWFSVGSSAFYTYYDPSYDETDSSGFPKYTYTYGTNFYSINYYNNLNPIYLDYQPAYTTNYVVCIVPYMANYGIAKYYFNAYLSSKIKYTIETNLDILSTPKCINKISIDVENKSCKIEYEETV